MELLNTEFFNHLYILLALMFGFTAFKIANCWPFNCEGEEFDWKKLLLGTLRNLIVIAGATAVFAVSSICGTDLMVIQMGATQVTLQSAIDITTLTILAVYGVKYIKNLAEYAGVADKLPETKEIIPMENDEDIHAIG